MALTLSTLPPIYPAYSSNLILNASSTGATTKTYYQFRTYINSVLTDTFNYFADPITFDATINLSTVLSTFFESAVYAVTGNTCMEFIPDSVIPYQVLVYVYDSGNTFVESGATPTLYMFNGCVNSEENFTMSDYLHLDTNAKFLTNWQTTREIRPDSYAYIQTLNGNYGSGYTSDFQGIVVRRYQADLSTSAVTITGASASVKAIINLDVSPNSLNVLFPNFIDSNTSYYTVESRFRPQNLITININTENKLTKSYNFLYMNRLGGLDFFTAVKTSENNYKVTRNQLEQFVPKKTYYTQSQRTTSVQTQFLTAAQADGLKELFTASAIKLWFNGKMNDVKIVNASVQVLDRYPKDKFIQYVIDFEYNYRNFNQQF